MFLDPPTNLFFFNVFVGWFFLMSTLVLQNGISSRFQELWTCKNVAVFFDFVLVWWYPCCQAAALVLWEVI